MKPKERQALIAQAVGREGQISVDALAARLSVSAETIRRDLGLLDDNGIIRKIHGGAMRPRMRVEGSFEERMLENIAAKKVIAAKLVDLVEDGSTIFIDTGSTNLYCAEALAATRRLRVMTNSTRIANAFALGRRVIDVFLLGGSYSAGNAETVGPMTIEQIARFRADHTILSPAAIDTSAGIMNADFGEASVARAMIAASSHLIVTADASKLGKQAAFAVAPLDLVDVLVCDQEPPEFVIERLRFANVTLR